MTVPARTPEPRGFREFEHAGWEAIPARYDDGFADLTPQAAGPLLDAAGIRRGMDVLDMATGPGYVAAAAGARGARVVGIDFSAAMVERARRRHPDVEFSEGDAEDLDFDDYSFDAVVMNFGLLHLARPERALAEVHRVLRAGGRFAFTVWAPPEEAIGFGIVLRAVERHGRLDVELPPGPPFFRFSEREECVRVLHEMGFTEPRAMQVPLTWRLQSADDLFEIMYHGTVRTAGLLRAQPPAARAAIRDAIREAAAPYQQATAVQLPMPATLATAVKA
jgi:ubiquinone/menaquinone biosynthesis C-methylase UbiE